MRIAAGIFLVNKEGKVLAGHPTNHSPKLFSIPKGTVEEGESLLAAAIRETFEETNINLSSYRTIHSLPAVTYKTKKKVVNPFVLLESENEFDFNSFDIKCESFVVTPLFSFPEMDDFKWFTFDECRIFLHSSQRESVNLVEELYNKTLKK